MKLLPGLENLELIIDAIPSPIFIKDRRHRIILLNNAASTFFGLPKETILNKADRELWPEYAALFEASDLRAIANGWDECEELVNDPSGMVRTVVTRKSLIELTNGEILIVGASTDVTAYREAEAHSRFLAFHDPLTGLPNRALFNERVEQALARPRRESDQYAILYIDLDRFKDVNDTYGHQAGDALVRDFAGRLSVLVRSSDTVARLGGDEFAVLLTNVEKMAQIEGVCQRILDAASQPFDVVGAQAFVSASIGVVIFSTGDVGRVELQRRADVALYQAKNAGRARYRIFTDEMDETLRQRQQIEAELRKALDSRTGLEVQYQPIVAFNTNSVVAFEALVRWNHPQFGLLLPSEFISVAEDTGLIDRLGEWVLDEAARTLAPWEQLSVAVNLSPVQLRNKDLAPRILSIIRNAGLAPERLQLEITENAVLNAEATVSDTLHTLRQAGIRIALDDFGTGYSSLSHLKEFEVDKVKIDRSFIQHLGQLTDSEAIVQAVTTIGKALGVSVTAEGVETDQQRDFLETSGCDELQGYIVARPLHAQDIAEFMADAEKLQAS